MNRREFLSLAAGGSMAAVMSLAGCDTELAERRAATPTLTSQPANRLDSLLVNDLP